MQLKTFMVPVKNPVSAESELNAFLRSQRVLTVRKEFIADGGNSFWSFCVEFLDGQAGSQGAGTKLGKVDYREIMKPEEFAVFSRLRDWRRAVADAKGVPVYTVFTNEQLAQIVRKRVNTKAGLKEIDGVGGSRVQDYGDDLLRVISESSLARSASSSAKDGENPPA